MILNYKGKIFKYFLKDDLYYITIDEEYVMDETGNPVSFKHHHEAERYLLKISGILDEFADLVG